MRKVRWLCLLIMVSYAVGCGNPTILQSITISPSSLTYRGIGTGVPAQLTAYGTFIHPSETRDITNEVTWTSAITAVASVDSHTGLVTNTSIGCGSTTITATADRNMVGVGSSSGIVKAEILVSVVEPGGPPGC
jgi:hypothetical protein